MKSYLVRIINLIIKDWQIRRIMKRANKLSRKYNSLIASVRKYEATYNERLLQDGGESDA